MGMKSLRSGLELLRHPVLWIAPLVCGFFAFIQMFCIFDEAGFFFGEKIAIIGLFILPFLLAGTYGSIKSGDFSISHYFKEGLSFYFRIILPGALLFFIAMLIAILASVPVLAGGGYSLISMMVFIVLLIPFVLFTFFFDTAAVFEGKKVFDSIRRSIQLFTIKTSEIISFYAVAILLLMVFGFGLIIVWSGLMADQLMPLTEMSDAELNQLAYDPEAFLQVIGGYGVYVTSVIYGIGVFLLTLVILPFKAVFYRDILSGSVPAAQEVLEEGSGQGEYDEKGRWYKYS